MVKSIKEYDVNYFCPECKYACHAESTKCPHCCSKIKTPIVEKTPIIRDIRIKGNERISIPILLLLILVVIPMVIGALFTNIIFGVIFGIVWSFSIWPNFITCDYYKFSVNMWDSYNKCGMTDHEVKTYLDDIDLTEWELSKAKLFYYREHGKLLDQKKDKKILKKYLKSYYSTYKTQS